jgi:hypothetical protein
MIWNHLLAIPMWIMTAMLGSYMKRREEYAYDVEGFRSLGVKY